MISTPNHEKMLIESRNSSRCRLSSPTKSQDSIYLSPNKSDKKYYDRRYSIRSPITNNLSNVVVDKNKNKNTTVISAKEIEILPLRMSDTLENCSQTISKLDEFLNQWRYNIIKEEIEHENPLNVKEYLIYYYALWFNF